MDASLRSRLRAVGVDPDLVHDAHAAFVALWGHEDVALADRLALEAHVLGVSVEALPSAARDGAVEAFYRTRWDGFELLGETRDDPIEVVDYDPAWVDRFAVWRRRLAATLGDAAVRIEHVGSTAVPGLAARPVVDIQISVADMEDEAAYVPRVEAAGVVLRSRDAEHRYFRPAPERPREVHVHVCRAGGEWEGEHLLFRNCLRANDDIRDRYAPLKRDLAGHYRDDRLGYTEAKSAFIIEVLREARRVT